MKYQILLSTVVILLLSQCKWAMDSVTSNPEVKNFHLSDTVTVAYNQTITNNDENISLRFSKLLREDRCPLSMECFWEGNAEVQFEFTGEDTESTFSLNTFSGFTRDTTISDYRIRLIDLKPWPTSKEFIIPSQYRARVMIYKQKAVPAS